MTQKRNIEFGVNVVAEGIQNIVENLAEPGLLSGGDTTISTSTAISIAPLSAILTTGILLVEDTAQIVTIDNTSAAVDYTVFYSHTIVKTLGGEAAALNVSTGLFTADQVNGTIVMWVQYPGGSIPLAANMISQPRRARLGAGVERRDEVFAPPIANKWVQQIKSGDTITQNDRWDGTLNRTVLELQNAGTGIGKITQLIPMVVRDIPPTKLFIDLKMDTLTSIEVTVLDKEGVEHIPASFLINSILFNNATTFVDTSVIFPVSFVSTITTIGEPFSLKLFIQLNPATSIQIASITLTTNADPV